jgi:hypothetical protein
MFFQKYTTTQFVFCQPNISNWQKPMGWSNEVFPNLQFQELGELIDVLNQS